MICCGRKIENRRKGHVVFWRKYQVWLTACSLSNHREKASITQEILTVRYDTAPPDLQQCKNPKRKWRMRWKHSWCPMYESDEPFIRQLKWKFQAILGKETWVPRSCTMQLNIEVILLLDRRILMTDEFYCRMASSINSRVFIILNLLGGSFYRVTSGNQIIVRFHDKNEKFVKKKEKNVNKN